uniref:Uncharacterized protein n=1 Tax=Megaselia scalaris TaxID=36166 RepID=T1GGF3_MEGSC
MNDLVRMTNELGDPKEKIILPSYRDALNIRVTEELGQIRDGDGQVHDWP